MPGFKRNAGFSLIELSVIIAIAGLLTTTFTQQYRVWLASKISGDTGSRMNLVSSAMTLFLTNYGRLPCPADPSLAPTAATAGYEVCPSNYGQNPPALSTPPCTVCRVSGARDANNPFSTPDNDSNNDPVLIGAVPFAALGLSTKDVVDGWDNKMTYAVSEYLTRTATFNDQYGAIALWRTFKITADTNGDGEDEFVGVSAPSNAGNSDAGSLPNSYMLAIVSHGPDGKGAYNYQGRLNKPCETMASGYDNENCDGDAVFMMSSKDTGIQNGVPGPTFYDDAFTVFTIRRDSDKWMVTGSNGMQNKSGGKVGIGTPAPGAELDVSGNILLEDFWAQLYCSPSGNCFAPNLIGGTINDTNPSSSSAHCGTLAQPTLMRGLDGSATWKTTCVDTVNMTGITPSSCPAGEFMKGIDATGGIICSPP